MINRRFSSRAWLVLGLLVFLSVGCGPGRHSGSGLVRFDDGEPVRAGSIELRSRTDRSHYASKIDHDGSFSLEARDGARGIPPGEYEAVVVLIVMTEHLSAAHHSHGRNVPPRYADYHTSGLRVVVGSADAGPIEVVLATD